VPTGKALRIAAVGDLHCRVDSRGFFRKLVDAVNAEEADVLVLCGDLTDHGLPEEAQILAEALASVRAPKIGVLGNHDLDAGRVDEVRACLRAGGIHLLDGDHYELPGRIAGFAGVKGFCGGFGRATLQSFGEEAIKRFVDESVREALKLEAALSQIESPIRVAVLHYAPLRATCEGESPELMPFLGSSRLAEPLELYRATIAFHGHAHHGTVEGRTLSGTPVYNVAMPVLRREDGERRVLLVDVPLPEDVRAPEAPVGSVLSRTAP
jgi:Icc-related predicted phosphoesterase